MSKITPEGAQQSSGQLSNYEDLIIKVFFYTSNIFLIENIVSEQFNAM